MAIENWMVIAGGIIALSVAGSKLTGRFGVPILLVFLAIGMLAGSDGPGGIWFSDAKLAKNLGLIALAFILFAGGMDLHWNQAKPHVFKSLSLATFGVLASAAIVGAVAWLWLGFTVWEGLLLGAIVASTDAAAVFSALSTGKFQLRGDIRETLEMESGSNDPTAVFLTLTLISVISGEKVALPLAILQFLWQMVLGGVGGFLLGRLGVLVMRKLRLDYEGLYHGVSIALVLLSFGGVALLGGNGFLAVYVAGAVFGQGDFRRIKGLKRFHDGISWLMQIMLFVVLGLLVFPKQLGNVILPGIVISAVLMLAARPIGVLLALTPLRVPFKEQVFMSWCGLRGAVPIVLAIFPTIANIPRAHEIFHLVFFVVVFSTLLQGTTVSWLAGRLGLVEEPSAAPEGAKLTA